MIISVIHSLVTGALLPFSTAFFYAVNLMLFLLPGCGVTAVILARRELRVIHAVILSIASSATLGYIAFWIYLASKVAGEIFSYLLIVFSVGLLASNLRRIPNLRTIVNPVAQPFTYMLVAGLCYSYLFFLFSNPFQARVDLANFRFFQEVSPGDNLIPFFFAQKIYDRRPLSPICCGDWLSSDRPPLQAGIFLMQRPLRVFGNTGLHYQLLATALQCLWISGVWAVLKALGTSDRRIRQVSGFLIFSGFVFYNTVYTWPKQLAATFILLTASILLDASAGRMLTLFGTVGTALCFSLALLAHSGSVFSTPGLLLIIAVKRIRLGLRPCIWAVLTIALFMLPWLAYQKFYDPPGNRLLKMHLAGVGEIDSRSTWQAIRDAYASRSFLTLLQYKWANLRTLIGPHPGEGFAPTEIVSAMQSHSRALEASRIAQREYTWNAIGIVNVGWVVALILLLRKKRQHAVPSGTLLIAMAVLNLIVWCIVLLGPNQTFTEHGSYADIILLSTGLLSFLLTLRPLAIFSIWILEVLNFVCIWAWVKPARLTLSERPTTFPELQWPLLIAAVVCALGLCWHFGRSYFQTDD